ncbi:aspartyl/asparaginyl beta-hydroxylase isoform X5 [Python bivittatus]|uniref:Aspartyl/asparaginyl beta-hydroxylase isoform X5 n=1 Tax=Python bivittatus TaxID=176946 RepID=A0A9F5J630_PYTBI|nr:aspartyl/asparaginyl beta-hydroxylase isoform X5 [Python bivittatus]
MAPRKSPKSGSPGPGARREAKHGGNKSGKKEGVSGSSFFTWFMVIALLGVWTSVAVVWFELVDYEEVLGKLGIYDADGDGDFDMEDAKVLLGVKPGGVIKSKVKVKEIKESAKKTKEKQQLKKEAKEEEKKKTKKKIEDFDIKDKKIIDDKSKKESDKIKQDRKTGKQKSELDKNHKDMKVLASDKDKEIKKLAKSLSKATEEDKRKKTK